MVSAKQMSLATRELSSAHLHYRNMERAVYTAEKKQPEEKKIHPVC